MNLFSLVLGIEGDNRVDFNEKCHGQSVSVMESLCLSWTVCACHGHSVPVMDSLFLSWTVCVCHKFLLSLSNTFWGIFRAELGQNIHDFDHNVSMRFKFVSKRR